MAVPPLPIDAGSFETFKSMLLDSGQAVTSRSISAGLSLPSRDAATVLAHLQEAAGSSCTPSYIVSGTSKATSARVVKRVDGSAALSSLLPTLVAPTSKLYSLCPSSAPASSSLLAAHRQSQADFSASLQAGSLERTSLVHCPESLLTRDGSAARLARVAQAAGEAMDVSAVPIAGNKGGSSSLQSNAFGAKKKATSAAAFFGGGGGVKKKEEKENKDKPAKASVFKSAKVPQKKGSKLGFAKKSGAKKEKKLIADSDEEEEEEELDDGTGFMDVSGGAAAPPPPPGGEDDFEGDVESDDENPAEEEEEEEEVAKKPESKLEKALRQDEEKKARAEKKRSKEAAEAEKKKALAEDDDWEEDKSGAMDAFAVKAAAPAAPVIKEGKVRVMKKRVVEKTEMDDKGYMHTTKVEEEYEVWEDVKEKNPTPPKKQKVEGKVQRSSGPAVTKKQQGLMGFFGKKK
ncbi:hypothetical protein TeGR_g8096 [Tetraparma gracilis]|uniref:DNA polymerase delta subunit 3 n=1 Tax=Tetraparma gracilis TaxID=2962635 RepID=A0ABQ6MRL3_9STRA|nr:hypothetical protein TeGR_g8096 [Tetraparma gracilis]